MLKALKEKGYSQGAMSRETSLGFSTVKRYLRRLEEDA
jgi:transposase